MSQWKMVQEAARVVLEDPGQNTLTDAASFGAVPPLTGSNEFGTRRDWAKEKGDPAEAKSICSCMASELLHNITKSLPYSPNACKNGNECYMWDAGKSVTPVWYKAKGTGDRPLWYWTPFSSATQKNANDFKDWYPTSTHQISGFGLTAMMQRMGVTDLAAENKFLINLMEDYRPKARTSAPADSAKTKSAKADLALCFERQRMLSSGYMSDAKACKIRKSGCLKNIVTRYFQFIEVQTKAVAKRSDRVRWLLDAVMVGLDLLGLIEPWGIVFDLLNAGIAGLRKLWLEMGLSLAGAIPGLGGFFVALKQVDNPLIRKAVVKFLDVASSLKNALVAKAKIGLSGAKAWFKQTALHIKVLGRVFVKGMEVKRKFFDKIQATVKGYLATPTSTAISAKASKLKESFVKIGQLVDTTLMPVVKKLCNAPWALNLFEATAGIMEYSGFPFGVKETGEWMLAMAPCVESICIAETPGTSSLKTMEVTASARECVIAVAGESFKKGMVAIGKEDELQALGEYDPYMFSTIKKPTEKDKAARLVALAKHVTTTLTADEFCGDGVPSDVASKQYVDREWLNAQRPTQTETKPVSKPTTDRKQQQSSGSLQARA